MIETREGEVSEIVSERPGVQEVKVVTNQQVRKAINYVQLIGAVEVGDEVVLNTTAQSLNLGTGGYDFIIWIQGQGSERNKQGHIMKLRYTPYQLQTCSLAEEESPYHQQMKQFTSLAQTPVVVGTLHSMLPAISVAVRKKLPQADIAYIMTDGAALPLQFSRLVNYLKEQEIIDAAISIGHAFGGDWEAVNIYTGLIGAYQVAKADVIIVTMGPGIVGTGTKYGFTGTEQTSIVHAADTLGGDVIVVPRISFADTRERHWGLSHHTKTNLGDLIRVETTLGIPYFTSEKQEVIETQLQEEKIKQQHTVVYRTSGGIINSLEKLDFEITTMGRSLREAREYFRTAGVAGLLTADKLKER